MDNDLFIFINHDIVNSSTLTNAMDPHATSGTLNTPEDIVGKSASDFFSNGCTPDSRPME